MSHQNLITLHTKEIESNVKYKHIMRDIIGDMLMNKVYYCGETNRVYLRKLTSRTKRLIKEWYLFTNYLSSFPRVSITVYRGVKNMNPRKDYHVQPIPFSTCMDLTNAMEWIIPNHFNSFIMCIEIDANVPYTFSNNALEGHEVILPAGYLQYQEKMKRYLGTNILYYKLDKYR
jgi:hypothetical protein